MISMLEPMTIISASTVSKPLPASCSNAHVGHYALLTMLVTAYGKHTYVGCINSSALSCHNTITWHVCTYNWQRYTVEIVGHNDLPYS
jgi:hypothetical protein